MIFRDPPPVEPPFESANAALQAGESADVVPIPFFPDDLPVLDATDGGFCWRQEELNEACRLARLSLFPDTGQ